MIDVSDKKYWKKFKKYEDVLLYLALLNIDGKNDWRIMRFVELNYIRENYYEEGVLVLANEMMYVEEHKGWDYFDNRYLVVPVRDV
jgi:hypothetical protein